MRARHLSLLLALAATGWACSSTPQTADQRWQAWADARFGPAPQVKSPGAPLGVTRPQAGPTAAESTPWPAEVPLPAATVAVTRKPSLGRLLRERRVALVARGVESLREVLDPLVVAGLPVVVMPQAEAAVTDAGVVFNLDLPKPIAARSALNLIAELAGDEVAWTVRHDAVVFTTAEAARRASVVMRTYDVRALTVAVADFVAPDLSGRGLVEPDEREFGRVERYVSRFDEDTILTLIEDTVAPGTWGSGGTSVTFLSGTLVVRHTPQVQLEVARLLAQLGA